MSEYGEPWKRSGNAIVSSSGEDVFYAQTRIGRWESIVLDDGQVDRIIVCVNFLAGVPTEQLERLMGVRYKAHRAQLLEMLNWRPKHETRLACDVEKEYGLPAGSLNGTEKNREKP